MHGIDLNSDLGENSAEQRVADDAALLELVTSANVSCGVHAGEPALIRATLEAAKVRGIAVGAHPSYRDREHFGRREMDPDATTLQAELEYQLGAFTALAASVGVPVRYVKPHGALYNSIAVNPARAGVFAAAVKAFDSRLAVLGLAGSAGLEVCAKAGLGVAAEAFADRAYTTAGTLVPRGTPGAVLSDPAAVADRVLQLAEHGTVTAIDGSTVAVRADSVCVHGDSPAALEMTRAVRERLLHAGITLTPFVAV